MNIDLNPKMQVTLLYGCVVAGDLEAVRMLLSKGCALHHPEVPQNLLTTALARMPITRRADDELGYEAQRQIIEALLDAGAQLPEKGDELSRAVTYGLRLGNLRVFEQAFARGCLGKSYKELFLDAVEMKRFGLAHRLLELGADPLYTEELRHGGKRCGFLMAALWCGPELMSAMVDRFTQEQKNEMLVTCVKQGMTQAVIALLQAGADAAQRSDRGRTLVQMAGTEEVKRVLRAFKTGQSIDSAMADGADQPSPPPAKTSLTL